MMKRAILSEECKKYVELEKANISKMFHITEFVHMKLNRDVLDRMLKKYGCKELGYTIEWYDLMGMGQACWTESSDDGFMDDTSVRTILKIVRHDIRKMRPYLQNPERVFLWKNEDAIRISIFLRDTHYKYDFCIWWKPSKPVL